LDEELEWAKTQLSGKIANKVVLVSDHGSSRLAVTNERECKWKMAEDGLHSGRCCPRTEVDERPEYATEENDFWVLANYDRFKGGRKASVEVHGGASLEEVVIPLIELELFDNKIEIRIDKSVITTSHRKKAEIVLFSTSTLSDVSVRVDGRKYGAVSIGDNKHRVVLDHIRKAGTYAADIYAGANLIGQVEFVVQHESAKTNDSDWF
jgi:hypothetical protein